jgi:hypothetical protein
MKIHLIGVNHDLAQRKKRGESLTDCQRLFQQTVESAIESIHPDLVAEEDHPQFLGEEDSESVLLKMANEKAPPLKHLFVDPDKQKRDLIGYKAISSIYQLLIGETTNPSWEIAQAHLIAHQFPIRERFWLSEIRKRNAENILFVCGDIHRQTFTDLLLGEGIEFCVFAKRIGISTSNNGEYSGLKYANEKKMFDQINCFCLEC